MAKRRLLRTMAVALACVVTVGPLQRVALAGDQTNFVSRCGYSHSSHDDPIVFPNQSGATHLHDFFANTTTDAASTYASLRAGSTTCKLTADTAAYWAPALYDSGKLVVPMHSSAYYTLGGKAPLSVRAFPAKLKVVAKESNVRALWGCNGNGSTINSGSSVPTCSPGYHLVLSYRFPDCWDGSRLDSADHTSHMAMSRQGKCPSTHPKPMPALNLHIHYPSDGGDVVLGDPDMPVAPHADFFNAWDQQTLERFVRQCLNADKQCGGSPPGS